MADARSTKTSRKTRMPKKAIPSKKQLSSSERSVSIGQRLRTAYDRLGARMRGYMSRRPHRSFRRTRRRDYTRSLKLPGYMAFTLYVARQLRRHWRTFLLLAGGYSVLMIILGGVTSQESYNQVSQLLNESSATLASGGLDKLGQAGLLLVATFASGPGDLSTDQQIYLAIILLFVWLSSVWLLREFKLGRTPRLRDALYNSGAPFISTFLVLLVLICQLLPIGIVALIYSALNAVGIIANGFGSMLFWVFAVIVGSLVMYWATSTLIALVIITLPGMYPMRALKAAGDLVVGRRLRITYRILWTLGLVVVAWIIVMLPLILLTTWLNNAWSWMSNVPIMPIAAAMMSAVSVVWVSGYVYILYRKVVDDGAAPA